MKAALAAVLAGAALHAPAAAQPLGPPPQALSLLGDTLYAPALPDSVRTRYEQRLAEAQRDVDHAPDDIASILWLGRRTAYLGRFREAIAIYSKAIHGHPDEPRLRRHRGHRYITLRIFELAVSDLEQAADLMAKRDDEIEPDGLPNPRNIPTSTLKFNIWYHLGLAHYLQGDFAEARRAYLECLKVSTNPDMRCATSHWLYMTLRRLGREGEARSVLQPIRRDMDLIENRSYHRLLLMYKGELPVDSLMAPGTGDSAALDDATIGYGVGNWHLVNGRAAEAEATFRRVVAGAQWPAFGHIAAEAEQCGWRRSSGRPESAGGGMRLHASGRAALRRVLAGGSTRGARRLRSVLILGLVAGVPTTEPAYPQSDPLPPPGRLVDLGGYRMHLLCTGPAIPNRPTVVLSAGGGDFAVDWALVQRPLSDSCRVCSYDRPGYGWSDPGPEPRTFAQEAFDLHAALEKGGERPPYVVVGHSLGAFVVRTFAESFRREVTGMILVGPANENGKLGFRGQFVLMRTLATNRPIPPPHAFAESPPPKAAGPDVDSCRARAERTARIVRPYDQLRAQAQHYRVWALQHPNCGPWQDDLFAEQMAAFYDRWKREPHPLGDLPLTVVMGTQGNGPPPGMSEADWRSDSLRIDLSRLSSRGQLVTDAASGHHVQLDNPTLVATVIREVLRASP
jgi:pimeloyl-ACP methyl ester carboxylesterase/tetratricopeptide (TPR) repeat protein